MLKISIYQKDIRILKVYTANNLQKCEAKLIGLSRQIDTPMIVAGSLGISLSKIVRVTRDRSSKNMKKLNIIN